MQPLRRPLVRTACVVALAAAFAPAGASADDTALFSSTTVAPNVLLLLDNSGSMNTIVWHPSFDPGATYSCNKTAYPGSPGSGGAFDPSTIYFFNSPSTETHCGRSRTVYVDPKANGSTRYDGRYLNWLFSAEADAAYAEIAQNGNGFPSACVGGASFAKYKRTRMTAAKQVVKDVVCQVNLIGTVRFGIAAFRDDGSADDPNGGYVIEEVDIPNSQQQADLVAALASVKADTWTPLSEALFQVYTYFMSRSSADLPKGKDGTTKFPVYSYNKSSAGVGGGHETSSSKWLADPVQYGCQKHFVIVVTDGEPTKDNFVAASPTNTAQGFGNFVSKLIGDYVADGETESQPNLVCTGCATTLYLDDIASYMQTNDFRPDFDGEQVIDVYTIGFSTSAVANSLLQKTATAGNGLFLYSGGADELAQAIIDSLSDILVKSQSFTAATVPASRTADGEHLYVSLFTPSGKTAYWEGHLRSYRITQAGQILDANGQCAVDDPSGQCRSGALLPVDVSPPFWDAADEVPAPGVRNLLTTVLGGGGGVLFEDFRHTSDTPAGALDAADLGVTFPPSVVHAGSVATNAETLAAEVVANVRGCTFGTGTPAAPCVPRPTLLSDIFHSNPVVVGRPALFSSSPSYVSFRTANGTRDRVLYGGSNGGFLHGFHAGDWQASLTPPRHDAGTGEELFGFMPWPARKNARQLAVDTGARDFYFVDGPPTAADAWLHSSPTQVVKAADGHEWRTVLLGGMRQGGAVVYALDVTNPDAGTCDAPATGAGYPCYLWEFPREDAPASLADYAGDSYGEPIVTKIRVRVGSNDNGGKGFERWVAVVSGGYDESSDPNHFIGYDPAATKGRALWILDLATGEPLAAQRFDPAGSCNGAYDPAVPEKSLCFAIASTPGVYDVDNDGYADVIYVGDLGGNVWKWVIDPLGEDRVNDGSGLLTQPSWTFRKFFQAPSYTFAGETYRKSFFYPPAATLQNRRLWLAFASGERTNLLFEGNPGTTADNNRFYSVRDPDPHEQLVAPLPVVTETALLDVTGNESCADVTSHRGFFFVGEEGEKWVTSIDVAAHFVFASSYTPSGNTDPCELTGEARLYGFRIQCGEGLFQDVAGDPVRSVSLGGGLPTDPRISYGPNGADGRVLVSKQGGEIMNLDGPPNFKTSGPFYWRERE